MTLAVTGFAVMGLGGCTVYPDKNPPTLATTTSAEQVQRIFWQDVEQAKWTQANALLAPMAVWRVGDRTIERGQIVPWLQSLGIKAVQVSEVRLTPAVNDINMLYTVQIQATQPVAAAEACAGQPASAGQTAALAAQPQTLSALAVWQQPQPIDTSTMDKKTKQEREAAEKAAKKAKGQPYQGYLLTVHDLTVSAASACR